jgi:hypothetical protein
MTACAGHEADTGSSAHDPVSLAGLRWELPCMLDDPSDAFCVSVPPPMKTATLAGAPGVSYDVKLRFRGVVEMKSYVGGQNDGAYFQTGGTPASDGWNIYELFVSSPEQTFFLNQGVSGLTYCVPIDYTKTIRMKAGATVTLYADTVDAGRYEVKNMDEASGARIVIPGVPPAPEAFHGQFLQMDVISVLPVP